MKWLIPIAALGSAAVVAVVWVGQDGPVLAAPDRHAKATGFRLPFLEDGRVGITDAVSSALQSRGIGQESAAATGRNGFRLVRLERGSITSAIAATGTVTAVITVLIGSQVSGQISEILADFNAEVGRGDVLARIDPVPFELAVLQAEAELEVAHSGVLIQRRTLERVQAEKENAEAMLAVAGEQVKRARLVVEEAGRELVRRRTMAQRGAGTTADLDRAESAYHQVLSQLATAEAEVEGSRAQLRSAEAQVGATQAQIGHAENQVRQAEAVLAQARAELERTIIRAPVDGTVIERTVEAGQTVAASLQAPTLFTIAQNLRDMQVNVSVDETDIGRVRPGQPVLFTVDAFPGRTFEGQVTQIRKASQVVQNVVTYTVIVATANPDLALLPGMTATVQIVTDMRDDVLRVPEAALRFRPPGVAQIGRTTEGGRVWIVGRDRQPYPVSVRVGLSDGHMAELIEGELEEGASVIVGMESGRAAPAPSGAVLGRQG